MAKKTITDKELEIIFQGQGGEVKIGELVLPILPFNGVQLGMITKKLGQTLYGIHLAHQQGEISDDLIVTALMTQSFDAITEIAADCVGIELESFLRLDYGTITEVVTEIIRVNKSFFVRRVKGVLENLQAMLKEVGEEAQATRPTGN